MRVFIMFFAFVMSYYQLFSAESQNTQRNHELMEKHLHLVKDIISRSPQAIKFSDVDKIYLYSDRLNYDGNRYYILLDDGDVVCTSLLFSDNQGAFLPKNFRFIEKKPFKCICNKCKHEWEGGVFTSRCPRCRSKDISTNVPNWP